MTIECWTVIHRVMEPIRRAVPIHRIAHHLVNPKSTVHAAHAMHVAAPHAHTWVEVVCRVLPAAAAAGGTLIPHQAGLPPPHAPPAMTAPSPMSAGTPATFAPPIRFAPPITFPPSVRYATPVGPAPPDPASPKTSVAEPSSLAVLLSGLGGLAFLPAVRRWHLGRHQAEHLGRPMSDGSDAPASPPQA